MYRVEIDQSGRVDQTDGPTVLALANGTSYSIYVSAKTKRECLRTLRNSTKKYSKQPFYVIFFTILLYFLLEDKIEHLGTILIDYELTGHEATIKEHLLNLFRRKGVLVDPMNISFWHVGKDSPSHKLAWKVFKGLVKPNREISKEEILREFGE